MPGPRRTSPTTADSMPDMEGIAREIAARRLQLSITQQTLADLAGVSRSSVQAIEYANTSVKIGALLAVLDALGMRLDIAPRGSAG